MANPEEIRDGANEIIDETTIPERTPEELRENDVIEAVKSILKTPKDIEDLVSGTEGRRLSEEVGLYLKVRDVVATNLGYTCDHGKYFNPKEGLDEKGLDETEKIRGLYPDSLIAKIISNRINWFGDEAPKGSEEARKFLESQENIGA